MRPSTTTLLTLLSILSSTSAQGTGAAADGLIVPFTSGLPVCASKCGPLFDVQGKCTPPNIASTDSNCFCSDSRLTALNNGGTTGVSLVCGAQSCTSDSDMNAVKSWFTNFCATGKAPTTKPSTSTAANGAASTPTAGSSGTPKLATGSSDNNNATWMSTHYKWVIMLVVIIVAIVGGWIGACMLRRRYLRRKEREIEMKPPVAWGPHQMQGATGGFNYGDGTVDGNRGAPIGVGGHAKEFAGATVTPADGRKAKRESKMQKKNRYVS